MRTPRLHSRHKPASFARSRRLQLLALLVLALVALTALNVSSNATYLEIGSSWRTARGPADPRAAAVAALEQPEVILAALPDNSAESGVPRRHLRVYLYDLPSRFNFGMLLKGGEVNLTHTSKFLPKFRKGLSQQHSVEYWLTLQLLQNPGSFPQLSRVGQPEDADVFFVPFFSSLAYNTYGRSAELPHHERDEALQRELVEWLMKQESWQRSGGRDHVVPVHHPNAFQHHQQKVASAIWIVADFGRTSSKHSFLAKDVVAPYAHVLETYTNETSNGDLAWKNRPTLLFFQGQIFRKKTGKVRETLLEVLGGEEGVVMKEGHANLKNGTREATEGMRSSRFCLHPAGDTPSSCRLFDAVASHCVPVIVSDAIELPFESQLDYSEFAIFVPVKDAVKSGLLVGMLREVSKGEWIKKWHRLKQVQRHFEYNDPPSVGGAVDMIWQEVASKLPAAQREVHRSHRRVRQLSVEALERLDRALRRGKGPKDKKAVEKMLKKMVQARTAKEGTKKRVVEAGEVASEVAKKRRAGV